MTFENDYKRPHGKHYILLDAVLMLIIGFLAIGSIIGSFYYGLETLTLGWNRVFDGIAQVWFTIYKAVM